MKFGPKIKHEMLMGGKLFWSGSDHVIGRYRSKCAIFGRFFGNFQFKISTARRKSRREPVDGSFERRDLGVFAFAIAEFGRPADLAVQVRQHGRFCRNCTNRARAQKNWAIEGPKVILFERRYVSTHTDFLSDIENSLKS